MRNIIIILTGMIFVVFFIVVVFNTPGGPNLIRNPSFENPPGKFVNDPLEPVEQGCNCKKLCGGSSALVDWEIFMGGSGQNCNTDNDAVAWVESPDPQGTEAAEGIRMIDLTGFAQRPPSGFGSVQQEVELRRRGTYELSFAIGTSSMFPPPAPPNGTPFYRVDVRVDVGGLPIRTQSFIVDPATENTHWEQHTVQRFTITIDNSALTITFSGFGSAAVGNGLGGGYLGIDNVSLQRVCVFGRFVGC